MRSRWQSSMVIFYPLLILQPETRSTWMLLNNCKRNRILKRIMQLVSTSPTRRTSFVKENSLSPTMLVLQKFRKSLIASWSINHCVPRSSNVEKTSSMIVSAWCLQIASYSQQWTKASSGVDQDPLSFWMKCKKTFRWGKWAQHQTTAKNHSTHHKISKLLSANLEEASTNS